MDKAVNLQLEIEWICILSLKTCTLSLKTCTLIGSYTIHWDELDKLKEMKEFSKSDLKRIKFMTL